MAQWLQAVGIRLITLGKAPTEWPPKEFADALEKVVIVGAALRDAQCSAAQAPTSTRL